MESTQVRGQNVLPYQIRNSFANLFQLPNVYHYTHSVTKGGLSASSYGHCFFAESHQRDFITMKMSPADPTLSTVHLVWPWRAYLFHSGFKTYLANVKILSDMMLIRFAWYCSLLRLDSDDAQKCRFLHSLWCKFRLWFIQCASFRWQFQPFRINTFIPSLSCNKPPTPKPFPVTNHVGLLCFVVKVCSQFKNIPLCVEMSTDNKTSKQQVWKIFKFTQKTAFPDLIFFSCTMSVFPHVLVMLGNEHFTEEAPKSISCLNSFGHVTSQMSFFPHRGNTTAWAQLRKGS